jgi:hypothetical protein
MDEEMMIQQQMQQAPEEAGRGTDTVMGHLSLGEVVIPRAMLDSPEFMQLLQQAFDQMGVDMAEFTVGDPANKINPETGYPEFFGKFLKKAFKFAAPIAAAYFAPGIGAALGSTLSAPTLGAIGGGLGGLATGGGVKGAALGALGGYGLQGGFSDVLGSLGGAPLANGAQGATAQTGILGSIGKATGLNANSFGSLAGGVGGGSSFGSNMVGQGLSSALGGLAQSDAIKKAQEAQLRAQQQQMANLDTFDPSNITNDAGYQFNLAEGRRGLDRSAAAAGGLQSGAALKAAAQYNQQYADNALNSAYGRYADRVGAQNSIYGNIGNVRAQSGLAGAENIAKTASGIFNPQPSIEDLLRLYGRA